jgi:hypothetical protein
MKWKHYWMAAGLAAALAGGAPSLRAEPNTEHISDEPPESARHLRVSAMVSYSGGVKVGFTDLESRQNFFLAEGESRDDLEIVSADFDKEFVVLRRQGVTWRMNLARDPHAPEPAASLPAPSGAAGFRGEGIESLLREHPEAVIKGEFPTLTAPPDNLPPMQGKGEGIEQFLRENPELRAIADRPAVGKGETIEQFLKENPDLAEKANRPTSGMGEGIEEMLRNHPEMRLSTTPALPMEFPAADSE